MSLLGGSYALARPLLFRLEPEQAHRLAARLLRALHVRPALRRLVAGEPPSLPIDALGLRFRSPVGVAAGFDKAAELYHGLGALGFGFVEVGTVTALPQPGNPQPRLFRLPADEALVNRLGFNNPGAAAVAEAIRRHPPRRPGGIVLGVNIGKSRATPLAEAPADYAASARLLAPLADYLVVNVSSPNTPGLRSLQEVEALQPILVAVQHEIAALHKQVPLLVKIAPDLADEEVDAVADLARGLGLDGIVAANTTSSRPSLRSPAELLAAAGEGGLSGPVLRARMLAIVRRLRSRLGPALTLVAVGGIGSADDAWEAIAAGASLVQLYTALVYRGPDVASALTDGLILHLAESGLDRLADAVGASLLRGS